VKPQSSVRGTKEDMLLRICTRF